MVIVLTILVIFMAIYILFADEIKTVKERDPAAKSALEVLLLYPGLHALVIYRIAHRLWQWGLPIDRRRKHLDSGQHWFDRPFCNFPYRQPEWEHICRNLFWRRRFPINR